MLFYPVAHDLHDGRRAEHVQPDARFRLKAPHKAGRGNELLRQRNVLQNCLAQFRRVGQLHANAVCAQIGCGGGLSDLLA